jgi:hypothetical protein
MRFVYDYPELYPGKEFLTDHLLSAIASPVTAITMLRRKFLNGTFLDPAYGGCADVELWMRLSTKGDVAYTPRALLRVRERDQSSCFFYRTHQMSEWVLRAKANYIGEIKDPIKRRKVLRAWRTDATLTGFSALRRALEFRRPDIIPEIQGFVRRNGTLPGLLGIALIAKLPPSASLHGIRRIKTFRNLLRRLRPRLWL